MRGGDLALEEAEFVAFDLETTGLFPVACRIVEFGAVRFGLTGEELGSIEQLVDPECEIPWDATRVHGITNAMVRGMPKVAQVLPGFFEFLGERNTVLLAHNASFDLGFLAMAIGKLNLQPPPHCVLDNVQLARASLRGLMSYRLETLARHLRVADSEEHRALSDSRLLMHVFRRVVCDRARVRTLRQLFELCRPMSFASAAAATPRGYEELAAAIECRRAIAMMYESGMWAAAWKRVTPLAFLQSGGRYYLSAYCHLDQIEKTYRLDRIRSFRLDENL